MYSVVAMPVAGRFIVNPPARHSVKNCDTSMSDEYTSMPNLRETCELSGTNTDDTLVMENELSADIVSGAGYTPMMRLLEPLNPVITKFLALLSVSDSEVNRMMSPTRKPLVTGVPAVAVKDDVTLSADIEVKSEAFAVTSAVQVPRSVASWKSL